LSRKRLEIARRLGRWEVVHNGVALCDFDTAEEAARAAGAVARSPPPGDEVTISIDPRLQASIALALTSSQP
jgi:hypothetical protein